MTKMLTLQEEIDNKKAQLLKLELEQKELRSQGPEHMLAVELHKLTCHWNHTDGCSWFYEIHDAHHDWSRRAHQRYLEKARQLLRIETDIDKVLAIVRAAEES